jgi:uncharacterized metal-binding protein
MAINKNECECQAAPQLIFPCSGAADVGEISDRAARRLTREGVARMYCLAGIGGRVNDIMESTKMASNVLVIDGCVADCAKKTIELAGISDFMHLRITDMGMEKGKSPAIGERIDQIAEKGKALLQCKIQT